MDKILMNVHSFVDVITNSSTELFVCNTNKSIDTVKEILNDLILKYKIDESDTDYDHENYEGNFEDMFNEPFIYTEEIYKKDIKGNYGYFWGYEKKENIGNIIIEGKNDNSIPFYLMDLIEDTFDCKRYHLG